MKKLISAAVITRSKNLSKNISLNALANLIAIFHVAAKKMLALKVLVTDGYDPAYGARPVKRAIQRDLENPIAKLIVGGKFLPGATIKVTAKDGKIMV